MKKILENPGVKIGLKIIKSITTIIICLFLAVIIIQKISNNNYSLGGYRIFSIVSESMVPEYQIGDILIAKKVEPSKIKEGDNLVYIGEKGDFNGKIITHEVKNITEKNGTYSFVTKGLANTMVDPIVSEDQVLGIIVYRSIILSFIGKLMSSVVGYFSIFILVSILVSYQIVKAIFDDREEEKE